MMWEQSLPSYSRRWQWIYDSMQEHGVKGNSFLSIGARGDREVGFFTNKGYDAVGIDLHETRTIINCDMSRMYEHPELKNTRFDIVFSCNVLEHCLDLEGFVKSLNLVCKKYFVCMFGITKKLDRWDCSRHEFMNFAGTDNYDKELIKTFSCFEIITNEVHKGGKRGYFILKKVTK